MEALNWPIGTRRRQRRPTQMAANGPRECSAFASRESRIKDQESRIATRDLRDDPRAAQLVADFDRSIVFRARTGEPLTADTAQGPPHIFKPISRDHRGRVIDDQAR